MILTESVLDALSCLEAGISTAIPIYGTNGFTPDHLDALKRERVARVILALDNDGPGRKATDSIREKLSAAGIAVRVAASQKGSRTRTTCSPRATATRARSSARYSTRPNHGRLRRRPPLLL